MNENSYCYDGNSGLLQLRLGPLVGIALVIVTFLPVPIFAQDTMPANVLAQRIEKKLLASPAVSMQFDLLGEGKVTLTADTKNHRVRIESPSMLVISDGEKIWNYQKQTERVTIDAVSASSPFKEPSSIFQFSKNYGASIVKHNGEQYQLELKPNVHLQSLLKSAGDIQAIVLDVKAHDKDITIQKATATSAKGEIRTNTLTIKSLKSVRASDFVLKMTNKMKVLDLRE